MKRTFLYLLTCVVASLPLSALSAEVPAAKPAAGAAATRIGVFKRKEILVAFYGSAIWDKTLQEKMAELEAWGTTSQQRAHRQLAGEATLTDVLEHLQDAMPQIAKQANVRLIVETSLFHDKSVELVDVTDRLVKQFTPARKKEK